MNLLTMLIVALGSLALVNASCPNLCSGHGSCGNDDVCTCYNGWANGDEDGGDCSQRVCPYDRAWVDAPTASNTAHRIAECSGRGICNRETGDCECNDGYTGAGCNRADCDSSTCNGHGNCEFINELRTDVGDEFKWTGANPSTDQFEHALDKMWDYQKTMTCVCDPGWTEFDCSRRKCPRSSYALYNNMVTVPEIQMIRITNVSSDNQDFALIFRSQIGQEYTTNRIKAFDLANTSTYNYTQIATQASHNLYTSYPSEELDVEMALKKLPNFVLKDVEVSVNFSDRVAGTNPDKYEWIEIYVTFAGDQITGDQYLFECLSDTCGDGCFPKRANAVGVNGACTVTEVQAATSLNMECSGRGHCNYESGLCECFEGYTDEACGSQTALI